MTDLPLDPEKLKSAYIKLAALIIHGSGRNYASIQFVKSLTKTLATVDPKWVERQDVQHELNEIGKALLR